MISFVIPAHNEEALMGKTLRSLLASVQAVDEAWELIVVDDSSTDRTAEIAQSLGARVVSVSLRKISAVRNAGARLARGEMLIFVDADTSVSEAVVRGAIAALNDGAVGGGAAGRFDGSVPVWARVLTRLSIWAGRFARLSTGCFLFCTRQAFDAVGGFDEALYAFEDIAISRALKRVGKFVILSETVTTSGRNLQGRSVLEALRLLSGLALHGPGFFRSREGLGFWYKGRSDDQGRGG